MNKVLELTNNGVTMVKVEQDPAGALEISELGYILDAGTTRESHDASWLLAGEEIPKRYLGG